MQFEFTKQFLDNIREIIDRKNTEDLKNILNDLHPADISEILEELELEEAKFLFLALPNDIAADVLTEMEDDDRDEFTASLSEEVLATRFIDFMDSDDAADVIGRLPEEKQQKVLSYIHDIEQAGDIVDLLNYDENTAGGLMAKELVIVNENWTVLTCLRELSRQAEDIDEIYYVYVVDDDNKLKGTLSLKRMILSPTSAKIINIYNPDVRSVNTDEEAEDVAHIMEKYDLVAIPVTDSIGRLVGRITIDDVVDVIREEAEKDYQLASGISQDIDISDSVWVQTRARLPWLIIGLFGGIVAAFIVSTHETQLGINPAMAFFMPLIAAMGGNVGVQSSAIIVQGLASNSLGIESTYRKLLKELGGSFLNASICSSLIFVINIMLYDSMALTVTVASALFIIIIFASLFGTFVPLLLNKFKIDPALATGPFITMVNDILGLFIYLSLGKIIFSMIA